MASNTGTPALNELLRELKSGYTTESAGDTHWFVIDPDGNRVRDGRGMPLKVPSTPSRSGHAFANLRAKLRKAGVLNETDQRPKRSIRSRVSDTQLAIDRVQSQETGEERVRQTRVLWDRLEPLLAKAGGIERVRTIDLARVASFAWGQAHPEQPWNVESAQTAATTLLNGKALYVTEVEKMTPLAERLEQADHARAEWFSLLRETLGLDQAEVLPGREWPFKVKLLTLSNLFADERYQRPVEESFVRTMTLTFDERRVGVIDVSDRGDNSFAIIDGLQRKTSMERVGKTACYAAVYENMSLAEEAALFFHKNRDRKYVHPYYHYRARVVAGDPGAVEINRIVSECGFKMAIGAPKPGPTETHLAAIRAVEEIYSYTSDVREECLTPTLGVVRHCWLGRENSSQAPLLKGIARIFRVWGDEEIQLDHWQEALTALGPSMIMGRARDLAAPGANVLHVACSLALLGVHNTGLPREQRLDERLVRSWRVVPSGHVRGASSRMAMPAA